MTTWFSKQQQQTNSMLSGRLSRNEYLPIICSERKFFSNSLIYFTTIPIEIMTHIIVTSLKLNNCVNKVRCYYINTFLQHLFFGKALYFSFLRNNTQQCRKTFVYIFVTWNTNRNINSIEHNWAEIQTLFT